MKKTVKYVLAGLCAFFLIQTVNAVDIYDVTVCRIPARAGVTEIQLTQDDLIQQQVRIAGLAEADDSRVTGVEVSLDGGETWQKAEGTLMWYHNFRPAAGAVYELLVRGTDENGETTGIFRGDIVKIKFNVLNLPAIARQRLQELVDFYTTERRADFMRLFDEDNYRDRRGDLNDLEDRIQSDFDLFSNMRIQYNIQSILDAGQNVAAQIYWNFTSDQHQDAGPLTGRDIIYFGKAKGMKIVEMRSATGGNSLFGFTNPDAPGTVTAPGGEGLPNGNAQIPSENGFNFSAGMVGGQDAPGNDIIFFMGGGRTHHDFFEIFAPDNGAVQVLEDKHSLANLGTIPEPEGHMIHGGNELIDAVVAVRTQQGRYAVFQIQALANNILVIQWVYQPNGTRNF